MHGIKQLFWNNLSGILCNKRKGENHTAISNASFFICLWFYHTQENRKIKTHFLFPMLGLFEQVLLSFLVPLDIRTGNLNQTGKPVTYQSLRYLIFLVFVTSAHTRPWCAQQSFRLSIAFTTSLKLAHLLGVMIFSFEGMHVFYKLR